MHALMTSKSYFLYNNLFLKIEQLLKYFKIKLDYSKVSFMTDFEKGLRKSLKMYLLEQKFMVAIFILLKIYGKKQKNLKV